MDRGALHPRQWLALAAVALGAIAADQVSKAIVRAELDLGETAAGLGPFSIHHVRNTGVLGGHLEGFARPAGIVAAVAVVAMIVYVARAGARNPLLPVAFGCVIGGSVGNVIDRLRLGYATDFLDRGGGGAFNLADLFILAGMATLAVALLAGSRRPRASAPPDPAG